MQTWDLFVVWNPYWIHLKMLRNTCQELGRDLVNQVDRKLSDWLPRSVPHLWRRDSDSETWCRSKSLNWRLDVRFSKKCTGLFWINKIYSPTRIDLKKIIAFFVLILDFCFFMSKLFFFLSLQSCVMCVFKWVNSTNRKASSCLVLHRRQ